MRHIVKLSTLSQCELWTIKYAEEIRKKAFQEGIPRVLDDESLLILIKQAWQWDKNAMIQYAKIIESEKLISPDYHESLSYFITRYSHELVDKKGYPLETPNIFQLPYRDFIKTLADYKYPTPASYMAVWLMGKNGDTEGVYNILSKDDYESLIKYTKYSIEGGYKYYDLLANTILFQTGLSYKDVNRTQVNKLTDKIDGISENILKEALEAYKICAKHGSLFSMMKVVEFYYYGIVVEKDIELAYAWSQLVKKFYQEYYNKMAVDTKKIVDNGQETLNKYNMELNTKIKNILTVEQIEDSLKLESKLNREIITWDYAKWESQQASKPLML